METSKERVRELWDIAFHNMVGCGAGAFLGGFGYEVLEKVLTEASVKAAVVQANLANPEVLGSPTMMNQMYQNAIAAAERMPSDNKTLAAATVLGLFLGGGISYLVERVRMRE